MNVHKLDRKAFFDWIYGQREDFMKSVDAMDVIVVEQFYPRELILKFRQMLKEFRSTCEPSWHPCLDNCPDYHRINDEYEKSYVTAKMHSYYFHRWNSNKNIFNSFKEIFEIKNFLVNEDKNAYYDNIPSSGIISRVVSHQYPRGGGYLAEHKDPVNPFAKIQTIIQAADFGKEFERGGVYVRETPQSEQFFIDPITQMGDLIIASPSVQHGVAPIDLQRELDWEAEDGRWMILPVIIHSDYVTDVKLKPKKV
jgi:hypothetical protein